MSGEHRGDNAVEPQSKRQKLSVREIIAFGGPMYDEATARKILKEVVLVSADRNEDGEGPVIGFDPDDAALDDLYYVNDGNFEEDEITPMIYFADKGDAKMCRYLVSRGASTTKSWADLENYLCPLHAAAQEGHFEICSILYANGAQKDVRRYGEEGSEEGWTPFHTEAIRGQDEVVRWLTLHGALCADGSSETVEGDRIYPETLRRSGLGKWARKSKGELSKLSERLVEWAKEVTQTHSSLMMFLLGTLPPPPDKDQSCALLQCLSGYPGVRKHIADFVGLEITKGKHLRILRQVVEVLPSFIWTEDEE